jgi:hypothetical protein
MSRAFRVGETVRIVRSVRPERVGLVTRIASELYPCWADGRPVHDLDLPHGDPQFSATQRAHYSPENLEPYWPGKEAADQSLAEILQGIRAAGVKESA